MTRWTVSEKYKDKWCDFAVVPAATKEEAIKIARSYAMKPAKREMKAVKYVVSKA